MIVYRNAKSFCLQRIKKVEKIDVLENDTKNNRNAPLPWNQ